jgi:type IV conjugative transfer system protein TraE
MEANKYLNEVAFKAGISKAILFLLLLSMLTNIFLAATLAFRKEQVRTIILPPNVGQKMVLSDSGPDKAYLTEFGIYLSTLLLNNTPSLAAVYHEQLLQHTAPEYYSSLNTELIITSEKLNKENISTWFVPSSKIANEKALTLKLDGLFYAEQSGKVFQRERKTIELGFKYANNKLLLTSMKVIDQKALKTSDSKKEKQSTASEPIESVDEAASEEAIP